MAWLADPARFARRVRAWQDDANPQLRRLVTSSAPLNYHDGTQYQPLNLSPVRVNNAQLDGWRVTRNGWHFAIGQPGDKTTDGWVGFGGRRGQHWLRFRLTRLGYLHWPTRAWQDVGGVPSYNRANLSRTVQSAEIGPDTLNVGLLAEWGSLWTTPSGGQALARWGVGGESLKEEVVINAAARDWVRTNRPPSTPASETWFGLVFENDWSDVPKIVRAGIEQSKTGDFADDGESIELRNAADEALAFLPLDDLIIGSGRTATRTPLRKRFWRDGDGKDYLLVGVRCDTLAGLPAGDLVFDPTIQELIGVTDQDGYSENTVTWQNTIIYVGSGDAGRAGFHYLTVDIPQGSTIDSATFNVKAGADNSGATGVTATIVADDVDNAAAFANNNTPHGVTGTTASTAWTPSAWVSGTRYTSPSIAAVVQEIVDRVGWVSGNNMRFVFRMTTGTAWANYLQIRDYTDAAADAAILDITYTASGGGGGGKPWIYYARQMAA